MKEHRRIIFNASSQLSFLPFHLKVSYECDNFLPPSFVVSKITRKLNMEFLFLPTDIIRQENQFGQAESFYVIKCPTFFNSLFVSFKYM